jgi:NAD+ kinase
MLLPDSMEVRVCVPFNSRSTAWASFDGRGRVELKRASLYSHASVYRLPKRYQRGITSKLQRASFRSLPCAPTNSQRTGSTLSRARSSGMNVNGKSPLSSSRRDSQGGAQTPQHPEPTVSASKVNEEEDEVSDEDNSDEEEKFDIDDLSSENSDAAPPASTSMSSPGTSPSSAAAASRAAEAIMGVSPGTHAKARSRSRSGVRSGVDSPSRFAPVPPRQSHDHGHGHVKWVASQQRE